MNLQHYFRRMAESAAEDAAATTDEDQRAYLRGYEGAFLDALRDVFGEVDQDTSGEDLED